LDWVFLGGVVSNIIWRGHRLTARWAGLGWGFWARTTNPTRLVPAPEQVGPKTIAKYTLYKLEHGTRLKIEGTLQGSWLATMSSVTWEQFIAFGTDIGRYSTVYGSPFPLAQIVGVEFRKQKGKKKKKKKKKKTIPKKNTFSPSSGVKSKAVYDVLFISIGLEHAVPHILLPVDSEAKPTAKRL
jgi:hypothetical protein